MDSHLPSITDNQTWVVNSLSLGSRSNRESTAVAALAISLSGSSSNTSQVAGVVASSAISASAKVRDDGKGSVRPSAEAVAAEVVAVVADLDMIADCGRVISVGSLDRHQN